MSLATIPQALFTTVKLFAIAGLLVKITPYKLRIKTLFSSVILKFTSDPVFQNPTFEAKAAGCRNSTFSRLTALAAESKS